MKRIISRPLRVKTVVLFGLIPAAICLLFVFRERWLLALGAYLVSQDDLRPADVIHVIAGEDDRTDYAIELYKRGYGKVLFFTGGWCTFHLYDHGEHARARALSQGVPPSAIATDDVRVTSTYQEVQRLGEWIRRSPTPVRSVIAVSDPFHMRRARWTYRRILGEKIAILMAPVPFERTPYQRRWWTDPESRAYVRSEYQKLVYYVLRYQIATGRLRRWLASKDRE